MNSKKKLCRKSLEKQRKKNPEGSLETILGGNSRKIPEAKTPKFLDTISEKNHRKICGRNFGTMSRRNPVEITGVFPNVTLIQNSLIVFIQMSTIPTEFLSGISPAAKPSFLFPRILLYHIYKKYPNMNVLHCRNLSGMLPRLFTKFSLTF